MPLSRVGHPAYFFRSSFLRKRAKKPLRLRNVPRRAESRGSVAAGRGYRLLNPRQTLYWKVDVLRVFGTKEHYAVLRLRRGRPK